MIGHCLPVLQLASNFVGNCHIQFGPEKNIYGYGNFLQSWKPVEVQVNKSMPREIREKGLLILESINIEYSIIL